MHAHSEGRVIPRRRSSIVLVAMSFLVFVATEARGQTGSFVPAQEYFGTGTNWTGVVVDAQIQNFLIDNNGDGIIGAGDTSHPIPSGLLAAVAQQSYHLNPSRDRLIIPAQATQSPCAGSSVVYVYEIPAQDGADLIPTMSAPMCLSEGLGDVGFFDDPSWSTQRTFFVREQSNQTTLKQQIHWIDLVTGTETTTDFAFDEQVAAVTFAPTGIAALVQYATSNQDNLSQYRLIKLCSSGLGSSYNPAGTPPGLGPSVATGNVALINGTLVGQIIYQGTVVVSADLDDCQTVPPLTGACCFSDGSCADGLTQGQCEGGATPGTYQGDGSTCAGSSCPTSQTELSITAVGLATLSGPGQITYTLQYQNTGAIEATYTQIGNVLPAGTSFVSASAGGSFFTPTNTVNWYPGPVAPGGGGSVSLTVSVGCGVAQLTNANYWIYTSSPPAQTVQGSPAVVTTVHQPASSPLSVDVVSTSDAGGPLLREGTATHVLTLTNSGSETHSGVHLEFWIGSIWALDTVVDAGGGTVTLTTNRLAWTGDVGIGAQVQIVVRTIVPACTIGSATSDALNQGAPFNVTNTCGAVVGTFTPTALALAPPPVQVTLTALNGGLATNSPLGPIALMRAGADANFEMVIANTYPVGMNNIDVHTAITAPLTPATDPPWIGVPPAGATWDATTSTLGWAGSLVAGASVVLRWSASVPTQGACMFQQSISQSSGSCSSDPPTTLTVYTAPEVTTASRLVGSSPHDGLFRYRPGIDTVASSLLCMGPEYNEGLGVAPDGAIWVVGFPMYRFDPVQLELEFFDPADFLAANLDHIQDIAISSDGNTAYLGGYDNVFGPTYARIVAWDLTTKQITTIFSEDTSTTPWYRQVTDLEIAPDGFLVAGTVRGFLRIDPANPSAWQDLSDPNFLGGYWAFALDTDGDILTVPYTYVAGNPRPQYSIDPASGVFTTEIADLHALLPLAGSINGLTCDENGRIWMSRDSGQIFVLDRSVAPPTLSAVNTATYYPKRDLEWIAGPTTTAIGDHPGPTVPQLPTRVELSPAAPNPFNPRTIIRYALPWASKVQLSIHDARGRRVRTLQDGWMEAGRHEELWTGLDDSGQRVGSGVYFVYLSADGKVRTGKVVLIE